MDKLVTPLLIAALIVWVALHQPQEPDTWQPLVDACLAAPGGEPERCRCVADRLHDELPRTQLQALLGRGGQVLNGASALALERAARACVREAAGS